MRHALRSLRRRLAAVFAAVAVVLAVATVVGVSAFDDLLDARHQVIDRVDPAQAAVDRLLAVLVDQETGIRGYALGGTTDFLEPYRRGVREQAAIVVELRRFEGSLAGVRPLLATALERVEAWRRAIADPTIAQEGPATRATVLAPEGKRRFDAIRAAVAALSERMAQLRQQARTRLDDATSDLELAILGGLAAVLIVGILVWFGLRRWVLGPLDRLGVAAERVGAGDLKAEIRSEGAEEIELLARRLEDMRERIVHELLEVERSRRDLKRSNTELEQFAYVASHDLQEPLRKVAGFCELLERRYGDQLDDRGHQYIEFAVDGAKRMQRLILDLLAFSRVGRTTEGFEEVDLDRALDEALANLDDRRREAGAEIARESLPTVLGDASLLTALLQNLVGNAIKFRSEAPPEIAIACAREDGCWAISVTDNGIGIEPEYVDRVFVIFQRLHAKDQYEGTGIGLAMCKKIVEFHGGRISVAPRAQGGTLARFTLPVTEAS